MKVSILSAVYNEEKHISEMIRSVMNQTLSDFELIFCDDGSTDRTVSIIREFSKIDHRIKVIAYEGKPGKVKAFNLAFEESKGDTIILLGGDDILPVDSLEIRYRSITELNRKSKVVAYFRLITFSDSKKFNNLIIPRGKKGNRSGGTFIMTRTLAEAIFPIDERLATEDVWLSTMSKYFADEIIDSSEIVLKYRIHEGNSNPRHQEFAKANHSLNKRLLTYRYILENESIDLLDNHRREVRNLADAEDMRYRNNTLGIVLSKNIDIRTKIFYATHSNRLLYSIRHKFFGFFSGR